MPPAPAPASLVRRSAVVLTQVPAHEIENATTDKTTATTTAATATTITTKQNDQAKRAQSLRFDIELYI